MPGRFTPDIYGHGAPDRRESTVVFHGHAFSAGHVLEVGVMGAPHRHTQFEINHVLCGRMTYSFDGCSMSVDAGSTVMFFGMIPHQVTACEPGTRFVCLYVPGPSLISLRLGEALRQALFGGSFVCGRRALETDHAAFQRWRDDLMSGDGVLAAIAREELGARLRRLEHDGWSDFRDGSTGNERRVVKTRPRPDKVEVMTRFIADHAGENLRVADVARAANLHPNYAMTLFRDVVGLTITDYLSRNRLDAVQTLLACSDGDIASVAFSAGFGSLSRFYEAFRARFGTSPAAFRAALRAAAHHTRNAPG